MSDLECTRQNSAHTGAWQNIQDATTVYEKEREIIFWMDILEQSVGIIMTDGILQIVVSPEQKMWLVILMERLLEERVVQ